jgi:hypothetical protein
VWVRRGLWQKKPQRFVLGLQSQMMDYIVEPGDFARAYDFGPTAERKDARLTASVSLFQKDTALSRDEARTVLGLDLNRPAVLVQLGTGDSDVNHKMTAALEGLLGWKELQVILTKQPLDKDGKSLAPEGLDITECTNSCRHKFLLSLYRISAEPMIKRRAHSGATIWALRCAPTKLIYTTSLQL